MKNYIKYCDVLNWIKPSFNLESLKKFRILYEEFGERKFISELSKVCSTDEFYRLCANLSDLEAKTRARYIGPLSPDYPASILQALSHPTPMTWTGDLNASSGLSLAVVGSRTPSQYTKSWFDQEFVEFLLKSKTERPDLKILSGGAIGVDQLAHKAAIVGDVPTVCFLPCGAEKVYPRSLQQYIEPLLQGGGAMVSPFPPKHPIYRSNFYYRNRIMILMSRLVFVVEAKRRSGTMMTASLAGNFGRQLLALPQFPTANTMGGLDLINDGVPMIRDKKDFFFQLEQVN